MKYYEMTLNYEVVKKGIKVDVSRSAVLKSGDSDFTLKDIHSFISDIKKIYKDAARLAKDGTFISVELTVSEYQRGSGYNLISKNFDRWTYEGAAEADGIHLNPDLRYTAESHDIWLDYHGDPLEDITA